MALLVPRVLKISVSTFRRELTTINYLCLPAQAFPSQIPQRSAFKVEQAAWNPGFFECEKDL